MAKGTVNKVILLGRLGQDPEVRQTQTTTVATMSLATNDGMGGVVSLLQTLWLKGILGVSVANWHT